MFIALLPERYPTGHEQMGIRPVIVIARPFPTRFPTVIAVPLTSKVHGWQAINPALCPMIMPGDNGLTTPSAALLDHLQSIDEERLERRLGGLTDAELAQILKGLRSLLGF
ncbi:MAG: type II toxin-antitoxin system PemK/MazF family toxin [Candidatus Sericytochromatia bacterium]|nr:type II toxin-antitoxin system PemK/MazF family toxin [Candidatus Sericytochromatia bacterium]